MHLRTRKKQDNMMATTSASGLNTIESPSATNSRKKSLRSATTVVASPSCSTTSTTISDSTNDLKITNAETETETLENDIKIKIETLENDNDILVKIKTEIDSTHAQQQQQSYEHEPEKNLKSSSSSISSVSSAEDSPNNLNNQSSTTFASTPAGNQQPRRNFTTEFKLLVLEAFNQDPECIGNQRATARKFGIHRRQVQKWIQQLSNYPRHHYHSSGNPIPTTSTSSTTYTNNTTGPNENTNTNINNGQYFSSLSTTSSALELLSEAAATMNSSGIMYKKLDSTGSVGDVSKRISEESDKEKHQHHQQQDLEDHQGRSKNVKKMPSKGYTKAYQKQNNLTNTTTTTSSRSSSSKDNSPNSDQLELAQERDRERESSTTPTILMALNLHRLPSKSQNQNQRQQSEPSPGNNNIDYRNRYHQKTPSLSPTIKSSILQSSPNTMNNNNFGNGLLHLQTSPQQHLQQQQQQYQQNHSTNYNNYPNHIDLVDELCYIYPHSDFSLLRNALLKNEISLFKLSPLPSSSHNHRKNPPSPTSTSSFALEILKRQNDYVQFLQSSGLSLPAFFSNAAAAAASSSNTNNSSSGINGNGTGSSGDFFSGLKSLGKSSSLLPPPNNHNFTSPKPPTNGSNGGNYSGGSNGNGKAKTVAAVLAATRNNNQSNNNIQRSSEKRNNTGSGGGRKRGPKAGHNQNRANSIIKQEIIQDHFDPTSMLELVSSLTSPNNGGGIDLTSTKRPSTSTTITNNTLSTTNGISFEALERFFKGASAANSTSGNNGDNNNENPAMSYSPPLQTNKRTSPTSSIASTSSSTDSDRTKNMVLEAFTYDPEVHGDARGVARKFGLNIRVVMKWLREGPSKMLPINNNSNSSNNFIDNTTAALLNNNINMSMLANGIGNNYVGNSKSVITSTTSNNKRKNPNPNQICDFHESPSSGQDRDEDNNNGPLDMVVPIKKRRLSTPTSTNGM